MPVHGQGRNLQVDPLLLQRCLPNLLVNAMRYARVVSVSLEADALGLHLHVDDRGPGIDAALLDTVTHPFVGGEGSRSQVSGGYGLGLSIAQRIAVGHGGGLTRVNREDGGLRATVWLPDFSRSARDDSVSVLP